MNRHYKTGYVNLLEIRSSCHNLYEIKTIAGFLSYKVSKLCFVGNFPLDAISHFKKHIDIFRSKVDAPELEFEHRNWVSKQFAMFGSLFESAVATGLVPSQSQNPGFYFFEAAIEAIARRKVSKRLLAELPADLPLVQDLSSSEQTEFFGQRVWRPGCQAHETLDTEREVSGIMSLQVAESTVNHSVITIGLLGSAITHFKRNKCPRLRRYMTVLVAEEYFCSGDYASALTALNQTFPAYKHDQWNHLSRSILVTCLLSAFHLGNGVDFGKFCTEFLDAGLAASEEERNAMLECLGQVSRKDAPVSLPKSWNVSPTSDVVWTFAAGTAAHVPNTTLDYVPLSFYVGSGCVRCRGASGHDMSLPVVTNVSHEPQVAAAGLTSPAQVTIDGDAESRQEIDSRPVTRNELLQVTAIVPTSGTSRTPIQITFTFLNLTAGDLPLELSIGNNDNFMFSGNKQVTNSGKSMHLTG